VCSLPSEEAGSGSEWHHLLHGVQPVPVCVRLWLVLPHRRPLLLPGWLSAGPAAAQAPRGHHTPRLLTRRTLPVHWGSQGERTQTQPQRETWGLKELSFRKRTTQREIWVGGVQCHSGECGGFLKHILYLRTHTHILYQCYYLTCKS
jgi:hypothetical protein